MLRTNNEEYKAGLTATPSPYFATPPQAGAVQAKLAISKPGDEYEQEADRISEEVMRSAEPQLQRACSCGGGCPSCQKGSDRVQLKGVGSGIVGQNRVPPIVHEVLRSPGQPLDPAIRRFMEPRFGQNFSQVRVHTDFRSAESAAAIGARAYTNGHHVVFGAGEFEPETERGRRLLAHELTHVAQQTSLSGSSEVSRSQSPPHIQRDEVQGEPEEESEEEPTAEERAADRKSSEDLKDYIHKKYWSVSGKIAKAESLNRSEKRQDWIRRLQAEGEELEKLLGKKELGFWETAPLSERLEKMDEAVKAENKAALALWEKANTRYADERGRLEVEGDYESQLALGFLDEAFDQSERRIDAIIDTDALVREDISVLMSVLDSKTYQKSARNVVEREMREAEEQLDRLSEVEEEGPGFFETAWSIIGCDSVGECLGDVALTVATGGAGKAAKLAIKGAKAARKIRKARKVVRSAKKLGKTLHKILKEAKALEKFVSLVKGVAGDAVTTYAKWLKKDWKKIASKISTDLISNYSTGEQNSAGTVAVARINKEFIATVVEKEIGIKKPDPDLIKVAIIFFMRKRHAPASSLVKSFILQSLKYRTVVNLSFESLRALTPLTESSEIFHRTIVSTIGECAQDTVHAIPFVGESGLAKYLTEIMRKMAQRIFG